MERNMTMFDEYVPKKKIGYLSPQPMVDNLAYQLARFEDFSSELLHHPTIRETMNKIVVKEDPHQESRGFVATMKMKNGKCFTESARSESLDTESVIARFREISLKSVGREASRTIEQYVMSLDQCESLRPLSQSLSNLR